MNTSRCLTGKIGLPQESCRFTKRLGTTIYEVNVHFNQDTKERISDKILHLLEMDLYSEPINGKITSLQTVLLPGGSA